MEGNQAQQPASQNPAPQPRRFVYRSVEPETHSSHPMRRSTDTPRAFQGMPGQVCPRLRMVKMRIYLKLN
jgi:hypothetical protein